MAISANAHKFPTLETAVSDDTVVLLVVEVTNAGNVEASMFVDAERCVMRANEMAAMLMEGIHSAHKLSAALLFNGVTQAEYSSPLVVEKGKPESAKVWTPRPKVGNP